MIIKVDSRKITKNDTFLALDNGHKYIIDSILNGATKIICEKNKFKLKIKYVKDTRKYLENKLYKKYNKKFKKIKLIGITGTNGKTTSSYLTYQLLNRLNIKCGYIGTVGFYLDKKIKDLENTTPDIFDLYEMINYSIDKGYKVIIMEVSSQAISYKRIGKLKFDIACFTNLTEEHLDYHKSMINYMNTKKELFKRLRNSKISIINSDDKYYKNFINKKNNNILFGTNGDYKISDFKLELYKSSFKLNYDNNNYSISINLANKYNIYNYMIALIICNKLGININKIIEKSNDLKYPKGRFELIKYNSNYIIIDYAHTPDGVLNILENINNFKKNKIITIIGCGGNRDKTKRGKMGYITCKYSTNVIFTNDNPRLEDEKDIMNDITNNLEFNNYEIIYDRYKAIEKGISNLESNDILVILGKGHEEYQIIKNKKIHFSDYETVFELTNSK